MLSKLLSAKRLVNIPLSNFGKWSKPPKKINLDKEKTRGISI